MNVVVLQSNGFLMSAGRPVETNPLAVLDHKVELGEDYCLRSFFKMIERYPLFSELNALLPDFVRLYHSCPEGECLAPGIGHLEFYRTVEVKGFPGDPQLEIFPTLCGMGGANRCDIRSFPLQSLLDMPVRIGKLKHVVVGEKLDVLEFDSVFNLFEFIQGIMRQLSLRRPGGEFHRKD